KLVLKEKWVPEFLGLHGEQEHPVEKQIQHQYEAKSDEREELVTRTSVFFVTVEIVT
ncbi:hypothetical protein Tco_0460673, partial [Tanacetum coccineum]